MPLTVPNIKVLGARLVVLQDPTDVAMQGIILPEKARQKHHSGTVVVAGTGMLTWDGDRVPLDVEVGDRVLWADLGGVPITVEGQEYLIINQAHILAIVGKEDVA